MSLLLKIFFPDLIPGGKRHLPPEILGNYTEAKRELRESLGGAEGVELVREIYHIMDNLTEQATRGIQPICRPKCAACCLQGVACTKLEMELIVEYLTSKSRKRRLVKKKAAEKAAKYRNVIEGAGILNCIWNDAVVENKLFSLLKMKSCPFLVGGRTGTCGIYPVRPIVCRFTRSADERCGTEIISVVKPKIQAVKFFFDQVAADIVAEETERICGVRELPPLTIWIEREEYRSFFRK